MALRARIAQRRRATIAQTKLLSRLRSRRNPQLSFPINCRHFNLRAERRFGNGDWHRHIDVVALARKIFMLANVGDDVQISRRRAKTAALALSGNPHTRASLNTSRNANLHRFCFGCRALAITKRTWRAPSPSSTTIGTLLRETKPAAGALHLA